MSKPQPHALIFAGETSGDIYGALLAKSLRQKSPDIKLGGGGGQDMQDAGVDLLYNTNQLAAMGLVEVLGSISRLLAIKKQVLEFCAQNTIHVAIFIDYPGFHVRLAAALKAFGIPVLYYISPKVWVWREKRIHKVIRSIDHLAAIFPFEPDLYKRYGFENTTFVGHPILDVMAISSPSLLPSPQSNTPTQSIGLLPGSRGSEISRLLPMLVQTCRELQRDNATLHVRIGCAPGFDKAYYQQFLDGFDAELHWNNTHSLIKSSDLMLCASGTVNLEVALLETPAIIVYKLSPFTHAIAKRVIKISHVCPVNIVNPTPIYPECLQHKACPEVLVPLASQLLANSPERQDMLSKLQAFKSSMGNAGASEKTATLALSMAMPSAKI